MLYNTISYYKGAPDYTFPEKIIKYVNCRMSNFQYSSYQVIQNNKETVEHEDLFNLPNNFFINSRMVLNIAFPNKKKGIEGYNSLNKKIVNNLENFSIKFYKLINKLKKKSGNSFIYSNFKEYGGIYSLKKILEFFGYKDFKLHGPGKNTFALWSGDEKNEYKHIVKETFNHIDNYNGSSIKIILGSPSIKEGVSLLRVRNVHILEPYWNWSRLD
jgi:hypothetical protein